MVTWVPPEGEGGGHNLDNNPVMNIMLVIARFLFFSDGLGVSVEVFILAP